MAIHLFLNGESVLRGRERERENVCTRICM